MIRIKSASEHLREEEEKEEKRIDLVYLWVDGSDKKWLQKRSEITGKPFDDTEANTKARFTDNEELKFSLRSVEKYLGWIRKIFIVTDNQTPHWIDASNPKIQIVNQREILPLEANPCFNSNVIEYFLYKIPNLSERFLYANDDMFFNAPLDPRFFFAEDGYPIVRLKKDRFRKTYSKIRRMIGKESGPYRHIIDAAISLIEHRYGKNYHGIPHHNVDAYRKKDNKDAVEDVFRSEIEQSVSNHIRSKNDVQRFTFSLYALAIGHAHLEYVGRKNALRNQIYRDDAKKRIEKYNPALFCMNDNQKATDEDRLNAKSFLESYFPEKSSFEK